MPTLILRNPTALKGMLGKEIGTTEWFLVTQSRVDEFANATEDRQWIHLNRERAAQESPYGGTIVHGFLTLSLISHFLEEVIHIESGVRLAVNYGLNRVRFPSAVRVESKIRGRFGLMVYEELPDAIAATYSVTVETEKSTKPCCVAEWLIRYFF